MKRVSLLAIAFFSGDMSQAEPLVAARTIPSHAIVTMEDLLFSDVASKDLFPAVDDVVGQEARVAIYAGRPIRPADLVAPALVERNQVVTVLYNIGLLSISVEARSLGRGGEGDVLRFVNIDSRTTITGTVLSDGSIHVKN